MGINKNMAAIFFVTFTGSCITIFANTVIISLILRKRQLWKIRFYIIANLAISDITILLMLVSIVLTRVLTDLFKEITMFIVISKVMFDFAYYLVTDIGFPSIRQVYCSTIQLKASNNSHKEENMFCFS